MGTTIKEFMASLDTLVFTSNYVTKTYVRKIPSFDNDGKFILRELYKYDYRVYLSMNGTVQGFPFFTHREDKPTLYDVITSLQIDCQCGELTKQEFLDEFLTKNQQADPAVKSQHIQTYMQCRQHVERCKKLFGDRYQEFLSAEDTGEN